MSKVLELPTQEYLHKRFMYEEETGKLYWKAIDLDDTEVFSSRGTRKAFNTSKDGVEAGHTFKGSAGQYSMQVRIDGRSYYVHRIVYKICTGIDAVIIDHEDGNPLNNLLSNLRDTSTMGNAKNMKKHRKNTSGHTGVSWNKANNKWEAYIWHKRKKHNLGLYVNIEDAIKIRKEKEIFFNYHTNHGGDRDFIKVHEEKLNNNK